MRNEIEGGENVVVFTKANVRKGNYKSAQAL